MNNTNIVNVSNQDKPDIPPIKKKRGRPRKYPIDTTKPKIKKKRGRPKGIKNKKTVQKNPARTRGRPKNIDNINRVYSNKKTLKNIKNDNVIIHLPIKTEDIHSIKENIFNYDPKLTIPKPWNEDEFTSYSNINAKKPLSPSSTLLTPIDNKLKTVTTQTNCLEYLQDHNTSNTPVVPGVPTALDAYDTLDAPDAPDAPDTITDQLDKEHYYSNYNYNIMHKNNWYKHNTFSKTNNYIKDLLEYKKKRDKNIYKFCNQQNHCSEQILKEFDTDTWPTETSIYCWWCCHPFNSVPCSIPEKCIDNTFVVYGNFCCPECCAAYLFNDKNYSNSVSIWSKYTLLNLLYKDMYKNNKIEQAYSRELLKIFGGPLSINEFRNTTHRISYKIAMPNMKIIKTTVEQSNAQRSYSSDKYIINKNDLHTTNSINTNLEQSYINTLSPKDLILKRSKPFRKYKNTLEKCMNLKLNSK